MVGSPWWADPTLLRLILKQLEKAGFWLAEKPPKTTYVDKLPLLSLLSFMHIAEHLSRSSGRLDLETWKKRDLQKALSQSSFQHILPLFHLDMLLCKSTFGVPKSSWLLSWRLNLMKSKKPLGSTGQSNRARKSQWWKIGGFRGSS